MTPLARARSNCKRQACPFVREGLTPRQTGRLNVFDSCMTSMLETNGRGRWLGTSPPLPRCYHPQPPIRVQFSSTVSPCTIFHSFSSEFISVKIKCKCRLYVVENWIKLIFMTQETGRPPVVFERFVILLFHFLSLSRPPSPSSLGAFSRYIKQSREEERERERPGTRKRSCTSSPDQMRVHYSHCTQTHQDQ
jgi:hypothetical protein